MSRRLLALLLALALWPASAHAQAHPTRAQILAALRRYAHEPTVQEVLRQALERAELDPARARALAAQARVSAAMPLLRVGVTRGLGRDETAYQTASETDRWNLSSDDRLVVVGTATFRLDRLLFASEEVALLREERALDARRLEIARAVVQVYFQRRRLQLERDLMDAVDVERELRILECEALLDAFTGGAFTRDLPREE